MSPIELYYMPESPPCRTVEMVANIAGVTLHKHYVNLLTQEQLKPENLKVNPNHKVPFMIDGDLKLGESRVISGYLATKYMPADNTFYPQEPSKRAKIDELLYFDLGTLHQASSSLFRPYYFGDAKSLNLEAEKSYRSALTTVNNLLKTNGKKFLIGDDLTLADVSILNTLALSRAGDYDMSEFVSLIAYIQRVEATIPKFNEVNDKPSANMRKFITDKLAQKA